MDISVYKYSDYKTYLQALTGEKGTRKGLKIRIAGALNCQPTYISQVIHRSAHLSLEHAEKLSRFLAHTDEEARFFILLVQKGRAGSKSLAQFFQKQIDEAISQRLILTKRLNLKSALSIEEQAVYYSSWHYGAIHIAVTIPYLQTKEKLAAYFSLSPRKVAEALSFLISTGLCVLENDKYQIGKSHISLRSDSPLISKHHGNWRQQAIARLDQDGTENDLHYSAVFSISKSDFSALKEGVLDLLKKQREIITRSKEEEIYCYTMDLFSLAR